jgi:hypothetical protein
MSPALAAEQQNEDALKTSMTLVLSCDEWEMKTLDHSRVSELSSNALERARPCRPDSSLRRVRS